MNTGYIFNFKEHGAFSPDGKVAEAMPQAEIDAHNRKLAQDEIEAMKQTGRAVLYLFTKSWTKPMDNGYGVQPIKCRKTFVGTWASTEADRARHALCAGGHLAGGAEVKKQLFWRIHTPNLLQEIVKGSGQDIYRIPCSMLGMGLAAIAKRASELNDPQLNALMCRLTLYEISDPESPGYNKALAEKIMG